MFLPASHGIGYHFKFLESEWFSSYKEEKHLLLIMKA